MRLFYLRPSGQSHRLEGRHSKTSNWTSIFLEFRHCPAIERTNMSLLNDSRGVRLEWEGAGNGRGLQNISLWWPPVVNKLRLHSTMASPMQPMDVQLLFFITCTFLTRLRGLNSHWWNLQYQLSQSQQVTWLFLAFPYLATDPRCIDHRLHV